MRQLESVLCIRLRCANRTYGTDVVSDQIRKASPQSIVLVLTTGCTATMYTRVSGAFANPRTNGRQRRSDPAVFVAGWATPADGRPHLSPDGDFDDPVIIWNGEP